MAKKKYNNKKSANSDDRRRDGGNRRSSTDSKRDEGNNLTSKDQVSTAAEGKSEDKVENKSDGRNDPAWYARDPQLLLDAARIPFSLPMGSDTELADTLSLSTTAADSPYHYQINPARGIDVPGLVSLKIKPSIGTNANRNDPANVAAQMFYTNVRYVNSGRKNYDPADLELYALAIADLYSYTMYLIRAYNAAFMYSQRNFYFGKALLETMGIDPDNIAQNLANFRYQINLWINKITSWAVPSSITIFARRAFMYSNIYIENEDLNIKDTMYMFNPDGFYRFNLDVQGKGMLEYVRTAWTQPGAALATISDLSNYASQMIEKIWGDEDFGIMAGDIIKAYDGQIITLSPIGEEGVLVPVYDQMVLAQFKNAMPMDVSRPGMDTLDLITYDVTSAGVTETFTAGNIYQDGNGNIVSREMVGFSSDGTSAGDLDISSIGKWCSNGNNVLKYMTPGLVTAFRPMLAANAPDPDPAYIVEATRLMVSFPDDNLSTVQTEGGNTINAMPVASGTEIVVGVDFFRYEWSLANGLWSRSNVIKHISNWLNIRHFENSASKDASDVKYETPESEFVFEKMLTKYAPMLYWIDARSTSSSISTNMNFFIDDIGPAGDPNNFTVLDWDILKRLHDVSVMSLMLVPTVAKVVNFGAN